MAASATGLKKAAGLSRARPLFVFDGHCVLCSSGAAFIMRHDLQERVEFVSAQSELGQAIYRHLGIHLDDSYVYIDGRGAHTKSDGYFRLALALGGWWRLGLLFRPIPRNVRDWLYDRLAAHRYRWFGKTRQCALLSREQKSRLLTSDPHLEEQLTPS